MLLWIHQFNLLNLLWIMYNGPRAQGNFSFSLSCLLWGLACVERQCLFCSFCVLSRLCSCIFCCLWGLKDVFKKKKKGSVKGDKKQNTHSKQLEDKMKAEKVDGQCQGSQFHFFPRCKEKPSMQCLTSTFVIIIKYYLLFLFLLCFATCRAL